MSQWPTRWRGVEGDVIDFGAGRVEDVHSTTNEIAVPSAAFSHISTLPLCSLGYRIGYSRPLSGVKKNQTQTY